MATGVEMLGQMSEDINLAGPVQGGNMVVKPNEAPVGAAAMLSKQLRNQANRGVAGIYELPTPQQKVPEFMQMAQANVARQAADQRNMYPGNFADDEGGILTIPRNLRTAPGVPETSLAYITDEEKAILGLLNPGTPHQGPEDVPSYDSIDWDPDSGQYSVTSGAQASAQEKKDRGEKLTQREEKDQQSINQSAYSGSGLGKGEAWVFDDGKPTGEVLDTKTGEVTSAEDWKPFSEDKQSEEEKKLINDIEKAVEDGDADAIDKLSNDAKTMVTDIGSLIKNLSSKAGSVISGIFDFDKGDKKDSKDGKKKNKKSFIEKLLSGGAFSTIMDKISKPTEESFTDNNFLAIMQDKYLNPDGSVKEGMEDDFERYTKEYSDLIPGGTDTGNPNEMKDMKEILMSGEIKEGSDLEKRLRPEKYWSENKPKTGQDFKDMAQAQREGKLAFTKANTLAIEQGRKLLERESGGSGGGGGRPRIMEEEEIIIDDPIVELGDTTMPYKGPRTGNVEKQVPLQRRFKTDPTQATAQYRTTPRTQDEIYKYMTEGTTGEGIGLEPFSEYQKRRRKALGLEPLGLYG